MKINTTLLITIPNPTSLRNSAFDIFSYSITCGLVVAFVIDSVVICDGDGDIDNVFAVGLKVGVAVGMFVGNTVGEADDGAIVGLLDGNMLGSTVGSDENAKSCNAITTD